MARHLLRLVTVVAVALAGFALVPASADPTRPDLTIGQAEAGLRYHFPGAVELDDGTILVAVRRGVRHSSPEGAIVLYRSGDGGVTWSGPETVWDSPGDDRDPKLSQTSTGRVFLHLFTSDPGGVGAEIGDFVLHSDDRGAHWSAPSRVNSSMVWAASHAEITEAPDGTLLAPIYGAVAGVALYRSSVVRSLDNGVTWLAESEVFLPQPADRQVAEPILTVLPNGTMTALLRIEPPPGTPKWEHPSLLTRSRDGGRTWSPTEVTGLHTSSAEVLLLRNGSLFVAYGDLSTRFGQRRLTSAAVIRDPNGRWQVPATTPVWDAFVDDQANPSLVERRDGTVLVFGFDYTNRTLTASIVDPRQVGAVTDASQLRGRLDLAGMVSRGQATLDTDLTATDVTASLAGPGGAIDGLLGLNHAALGTTAPGHVTVSFTRPRRIGEVGVALRPGEAQPAVLEVRGQDGTWREVASLTERFRYGDVDWFRLGQVITAVRVTTTPMVGPRPPNSGATKPIAVSELALRP